MIWVQYCLVMWDWMFKILVLGAKFGEISFLGCKPPKMTFFEKFLQILFSHITWHKKITTHFGFEDRSILPLPLASHRSDRSWLIWSIPLIDLIDPDWSDRFLGVGVNSAFLGSVFKSKVGSDFLVSCNVRKQHLKKLFNKSHFRGFAPQKTDYSKFCPQNQDFEHSISHNQAILYSNHSQWLWMVIPSSDKTDEFWGSLTNIFTDEKICPTKILSDEI